MWPGKPRDGVTTTAAARRNAGAIGAAILYLAAIALVLIVRMPPVMDFPNHLARIWLLAGGAESWPMSGFYEVRWSQASTNVAVDYLAASLGRVLPIFAVSKLLVILIFIGPPMAAALLNRRVFGRFSAWSASFLLLAWTTTSVSGFLGYQVSLVVALVATAAIKPLVERRPGGTLLAWHLVISAVLLTVHPFGLVFYLALLAGLAIGEDWPLPISRQRVGRAALVIVPATLVSVAVVIGLFALAPHAPTTGRVEWWPSFREKLAPFMMLRTLLSPILSYDRRVDLVFAGGLAALLVIAAALGRVRAHWGLLLVAVVLAAVSIVMPSAVGDALWIERRTPLMAALTLFASLDARPIAPGERPLLPCLLLAIVAARVAWIGDVWLARRHDAPDLIASARVIPPGSTVLLLRTDPKRSPRMPVGRLVDGNPYYKADLTSRHLGALLVITRHVFVPTLFTIPGQHALAVRPAYRSRSVTNSGTPTLSALGSHDPADPYLADWRCGFDYVVLSDLDAGGPSLTGIPGVRIVAASGFDQVGRIVRPAACAAAGAPVPR